MGKTEHPLKIGFYSPYFSMLGGGERYILTIADALSHKHNVYLYAPRQILDEARKKFNITLDRIHLIPKNLFRTNYDILFYMTDGSVFISTASKNFLIIQSPAHLPRLSLINKLKLFNWQILCYSSFMQKIIAEHLGKNALILSPCIETVKFKSQFSQKENMILTVGRYFKKPHDKKQDVLLEIFKNNYQKYFLGWKLVIAGGLTEGSGKEILKNIKGRINGFPVDIVVNPSFSSLLDLYKKAKLYWHAAGFGEDLVSFPERAEHFGITTLEAMAAGAVPIVFGGGGQLDIISEGKNGYLWKSEEELVNKSVQLINNSKLLHHMSIKVVDDVKRFSRHKFNEKLEKIIYSQ